MTETIKQMLKLYWVLLRFIFIVWLVTAVIVMTIIGIFMIGQNVSWFLAIPLAFVAFFAAHAGFVFVVKKFL